MFKADVKNHTSQENHPDKRTKVRREVVDILSKKALAELFFGSAKAFCDAWVYRQTEAAVTYHGGFRFLNFNVYTPLLIMSFHACL